MGIRMVDWASGFMAMWLLSSCDTHTTAPERPRAKAAPRVEHHRAVQLGQIVWTLSDEGLTKSKPGQLPETTLRLPGWVSLEAGSACLPDMAVSPAGDLIVTSNIMRNLWQVSSEGGKLSVHQLSLVPPTEREVGFSGLAYSAQHNAYFAVSHQDGSIWRVTADLGSARRITASGAIPEGCGFSILPPVIGHRWHGPGKLCVRGATGLRLVSLSMSGDSARVTDQPCSAQPPANLEPTTITDPS